MIERDFLVTEIDNLEHQKALALGKAALADEQAEAHRRIAQQADGAIQSYRALIDKLDKAAS